MSGNQKKTVKTIIIGFILVAIIVGYYFYLSNRRPREAAEENAVSISVTEKLLLRNLENDYPPTPKEVIKLYADITQCFYGETYTDEEYKQLALKMRELYDEELLGINPEQEYLDSLKQDINNMKQSNIVVSSYATSAGADVDYFSENGYEWARMYCSFTLRAGKSLTLSKEVFILRKDENSHWKIYGWKLVDED